MWYKSGINRSPFGCISVVTIMSGDGNTSPRCSGPANESLQAGPTDIETAINGKLEEDLYSDIDPVAGGPRPAVNAVAKDRGDHPDGKDRNGHDR